MGKHGEKTGEVPQASIEAAVVEYLRSLPPEALVTVLQQVFATSLPFPLEKEFLRNRFFLGVASSRRERGEPEKWGSWQVEAVAYPDPEFPGRGPSGLCNSSVCGECGVGVRSNDKSGVCPICGAVVGLS